MLETDPVARAFRIVEQAFRVPVLPRMEIELCRTIGQRCDERTYCLVVIFVQRKSDKRSGIGQHQESAVRQGQHGRDAPETVVPAGHSPPCQKLEPPDTGTVRSAGIQQDRFKRDDLLIIHRRLGAVNVGHRDKEDKQRQDGENTNHAASHN